MCFLECIKRATGVPFCVQPSRDFWQLHPKCTWYEAMNASAVDFDEHFSALGSKDELARHGIYVVNNSDHGGFEHPRCPFGKNGGSPIKWYTFGARLPSSSSVQSWYACPTQSTWPPRVLSWLQSTTTQSPAPKRKAAKKAAEEPVAKRHEEEPNLPRARRRR
jgi:hypothetical protein